MFLKCFVLLALTLCLTVSAGYLVWAHCHNNTACEDLVNDLVSPKKWKEPNGNTVNYYINNRHYSNPPDITTDVKNAAKKWSNLRVNNIDVAFKLHCVGATDASPDLIWSDGKSVVGWGDLGNEWNSQIAVTVTWTHDDDDNRIIEQDMIFNYYKKFDRHNHTDNTEYCIYNVATHEFGHWVRLKDLDRSHQCDNPYAHYTMWKHIAKNEHKKISLRCEDKWALWYVYHGSP
ncbi:MAG: hypothetical protein OXT74_14465 [Candidatus Poribacteria bacterium]|nr:hypothetical protein [Candidatus Poribacteria bacterium]